MLDRLNRKKSDSKGKKSSRGGNVGNNSNHNSSLNSYTNNGGSDNHMNHSGAVKDDMLDVWEKRLQTEVDSDFFQDPASFPTLHRVIDVLGAQLGNNSSGNTIMTGMTTTNNTTNNNNNSSSHDNNPAYTAMMKQRDLVEKAIEYMAVSHCSEFNSSVVAVGNVSRQFTTAVAQVRTLRRQVREIKENLARSGGGAAAADAAAEANNNSRSSFSGTTTMVPTTASIITANSSSNDGGSNSKSLRELWLKKLECEAVLSLLHKLEVVREAPMAFDALIQNRRIGAAVVLLMNGISTSFEDDVAQVKALHKIVDQLMTRKQRALDIVWDTLANVLYLRTANTKTTNSTNNNGTTQATNDAMMNNTEGSDEEEYDYDEESMNSDPMESESISTSVKRHSLSQSQNKNNVRLTMVMFSMHGYRGQLLPKPMIESELNLEVDEMRCLEDWNNPMYPSNKNSNNSNSTNSNHTNSRLSSLPRYNDPIMALRILVECLHKLNRLIDVDTTLIENVTLEIRKIAELEQVKTFTRMEQPPTTSTGNNNGSSSGTKKNSSSNNGVVVGENDAMEQHEITLREFRIHLSNLCRAYGNVMKRLSFLAQMLRHKLNTSDMSSGNNALHAVLSQAEVAIQNQIKQFLSACLIPPDDNKNNPNKNNTSNSKGNNNSNSTALRSFMGGGSGNHQSSNISAMNHNYYNALYNNYTYNNNSRTNNNNKSNASVGAGVSSMEQGMFSLGIITSEDNLHPRVSSAASSSNNNTHGGANNFLLLRSPHYHHTNQLMMSNSKSSIMSMSMEQFVIQVLFPHTNSSPDYHHALIFRHSVAAFTKECDNLKTELALLTNNSSIPASNKAINRQQGMMVSNRKKKTATNNTNNANNNNGINNEEDNMEGKTALEFLDHILHTKLLPVMQSDSTMALVTALEKADAFEPPSNTMMFTTNHRSSRKAQAMMGIDVDMCLACQTLYESTGPLFSAMHRVPKDKEMYTPLVAVLEHSLLTFTSRVSQRMDYLCRNKTATTLLDGKTSTISNNNFSSRNSRNTQQQKQQSRRDIGKNKTQFSIDMERRSAYQKLIQSYFEKEDQDLVTTATATASATSSSNNNTPTINSPKEGSKSSPSKDIIDNNEDNDDDEETVNGNLKKERECLGKELRHLHKLMDFTVADYEDQLNLCDEDELMRAACLAHSLLVLSGMMELRLEKKFSTRQQRRRQQRRGSQPDKHNDSWVDEKKTVSTPPRTLRDAIQSIRLQGLAMAKFCRLEILLQT